MQNNHAHLILSRNNLKLVALTNEHRNALAEIALEKEIWKYAPHPYDQPEIFEEKWLDKAFAQMQKNERQCFTIFADNKVIGSSSFYEIDLKNKKTNLGYTWFHPSVWGSKMNALSKLILLEYAFETLELNRVGFSIDSLNERSCHAVKKIGIKYEGTLRNDLILHNGRVRDSVIFSVIRNEWPDVKKVIETIVG